MAGSVNTIPGQTFHNINVGAQIFTNEVGSIIAGCRSISVRNIGAANGTFDGITIVPNEVFNYPWVGMTYDTVNFDCVGTEFKIITFR